MIWLSVALTGAVKGVRHNHSAVPKNGPGACQDRRLLWHPSHDCVFQCNHSRVAGFSFHVPMNARRSISAPRATHASIRMISALTHKACMEGLSQLPLRSVDDRLPNGSKLSRHPQVTIVMGWAPSPQSGFSLKLPLTGSGGIPRPVTDAKLWYAFTVTAVWPIQKPLLMVTVCAVREPTLHP